MSILTKQEKAAIAKDVSVIFGTVVGTPEINVAKVVATEAEFAKDKVADGKWTKRRAQKHMDFSVKAAASMYASRRALKQKKTKAALLALVNTLGGMVNAKVGFDLFPLP